MATTLAPPRLRSSEGILIAFDGSSERPPVIPDDVLAPALFEFLRGSRFGSV